MKQLVLVASVVVLGAQASASFDLMYIPVRAENRVARYDPVNRIFLGGFNAPGAARVLAGNERYGHIQTSAGGYRFDMFTGAQVGYLGGFISIGSYDRVNGRAVRHGSGSVNYQNLETGAATTAFLASPAAGTSYAANMFSNNAYGYFTSDSGTLRSSFHSSSGNFISAGSTITLATNASLTSNSIQWRNRSGSDMISTAIFDTASNAFRIFHMMRNSSNVYSTFIGSSLNGFALNQPVSLAPAHNGYYVIGADLASPGSLTRITQYDDDGTGFQYDSWTVNLNVSGNNSFGVGMVIAPEPGTMIALGAGVLALLKRRKRA